MARPREFDEPAVLEAATDLFWTNGFEATSTRDLCARTGLTPSSMYAAFGDKRRLYRRTLQHYLERLRDKMDRLEEALAPGAAITGFFQDTIERSVADTSNRGCMLVNSALEASPQDSELRDAIASEMALIEEFFRARIVAGQRRGDIPRDQSANGAARQLLTVLIGVRVLARVRPDEQLLRGAVDRTLEALGVPPLAPSSDTSVQREF